MKGHTAPHWLNRIGKHYWRRLHPQLDLTESSREQLAILCDAYATFRQAAEIIEEEGIITEGSTGQMKEHPAVSIKNKAADMIRRLTKILFTDDTGQVEEVDDLDQFMQGD